MTTEARTVGSPAPERPKPGLVARVTLLGKRIAGRKGVAHLIRAFTRYSDRLGSQFAGAITYFSFLALVPILMVAFSVVGFVLAGRPDLVTEIADKISGQLPGDLGSDISKVIDTAISSRLTVGIVGLLVALYSGINWMGNLREAVRAQWRPQFEEPAETKDNFFVALFKNLVNLAGLGIAIVVSVALTSIGTGAQTYLLDLLGLSDVTWLSPVFVILAFAIAIAADVLIFFWLYSRLPEEHYRPPRKALWRGALAAAVAFEVFKFALTFLLPKVTTTATGAVFGSVIGLLFFINLVSQMLLFVAAWVATAPGAAEAEEELPEIPGPAVAARHDVGAGGVIGLVGVGAALGWVAGRRRAP